MFGLIDSQITQQGQSSQNSQLYLQNESFDVSIGHGLVRIKVIQSYLNYHEKQQDDIQFYFRITKSLVLESATAELVSSQRTAQIAITDNLTSTSECSESDSLSSTLAQIHSPQDEIFRFKLPHVQPQEQIILSIVYTQKIKLNRQGVFSLELPQSEKTASYPISTKIHFEEREGDKSISYNSVNHELNVYEQVILVDDGNTQGLQALSLRSNYNNNLEKPFIINFAYNDNNESNQYRVSNTFLSSQQIFSDQEQTQNYSVISVSAQTNKDQLKAIQENKNNKLDYNSDQISKSLILNNSQSEFLVILDRSGCMTGSRFNQAIEGVQLFLKSLPTNSYFNVISQGSGNKLEQLFNSSVPYTQDNLQTSINRIRGFQTNLGSQFNLIHVLEHTCQLPSISQYSRQIILISDLIDLQNSLDEVQAFLENKKEYLKYPIHTIQTQSNQDKLLPQQISQSTKGVFVSNDKSDPETVLNSILNLIPLTLQPTLSDFQIILNKNNEGNENVNFNNIQIFPDLKTNYQSVQFDEQVLIFISLDSSIKELKSLPATLKFYNSSLKSYEEHEINLLQCQKEGAAHLSKEFKKSIFKFSVSEHINSIKNNNKQAIDLSLKYQVYAHSKSTFITNSYKISENNNEEKSLIPEQSQLHSIRQKISYQASQSINQDRKRSGSNNNNVNFISLYGNLSNQPNDNGSENKTASEINNLIDAIFMGDQPSKNNENKDNQTQSHKSGSIQSSSGQHADLLDIGDDDNQSTTSSHPPINTNQMSEFSNQAQQGDPNNDLNDDILDLISSAPQNQTQQVNQQQQQQQNNNDMIDLLDDFMIGDSPSSSSQSSQSKSDSVKMIEILDNINYDGLFNGNKLILNSILGGKLDQFNSEIEKLKSEKNENVSLDQFSTFVVLSYLQKNHIKDQKKWFLIELKAHQLLSSTLSQPLYQSLKEFSSKYLN